MELKKYSVNGIAEMMYYSVCNIKRYETKRLESGISTKELKEVHSQIKCRISYESDSANEESETLYEINRRIKVFLPIETDIKSGDILVITRNGKSEKFEAASKGKAYRTHLEVEVKPTDKNP